MSKQFCTYLTTYRGTLMPMSTLFVRIIAAIMSILLNLVFLSVLVKSIPVPKPVVHTKWLPSDKESRFEKIYAFDEETGLGLSCAKGSYRGVGLATNYFGDDIIVVGDRTP